MLCRVNAFSHKFSSDSCCTYFPRVYVAFGMNIASKHGIYKQSTFINYFIIIIIFGIRIRYASGCSLGTVMDIKQILQMSSIILQVIIKLIFSYLIREISHFYVVEECTIQFVKIYINQDRFTKASIRTRSTVLYITRG